MECFNFDSAQTVDGFRIKLSKIRQLTALSEKITIVHKLSSERPLKNGIILLTCLSESPIVILSLVYVFAISICLLIFCKCNRKYSCRRILPQHGQTPQKSYCEVTFRRSVRATKDTQV